MEHHLERKFNISVNSMRSEGERDLVFHSEFRVSKFDAQSKTIFDRLVHAWH